jgi:hypothetical protein
MHASKITTCHCQHIPHGMEIIKTPLKNRASPPSCFLWEFLHGTVNFRSLTLSSSTLNQYFFHFLFVSIIHNQQNPNPYSPKPSCKTCKPLNLQIYLFRKPGQSLAASALASMCLQSIEENVGKRNEFTFVLW